MNNFIKQIIEEKFVSKAQQKYFYAKAGDKTSSPKERKKWEKIAHEFSDKTDFKHLPKKVKKPKKEVDEIVDDQGNIARGKKPTDLNTKGITDNKTSDEVAKMSSGQMGSSSAYGSVAMKYYGMSESDLSKSLGYEDTLGDDESFKEAYRHFTKELGLTHEEAIDRLGQMGYDQKLPDDKIRLVENPKKFMEEYIESILSKKNDSNDILNKDNDLDEEKEINPIILKQIKSLKNSLDSHNLSLKDILKHLK